MKLIPTCDVKIGRIYLFYNKKLVYMGIGKVSEKKYNYHEYSRWTYDEPMCNYDTKHPVALEYSSTIGRRVVIILPDDMAFELTDEEIITHVVLEII